MNKGQERGRGGQRERSTHEPAGLLFIQRKRSGWGAKRFRGLVGGDSWKGRRMYKGPSVGGETGCPLNIFVGERGLNQSAADREEGKRQTPRRKGIGVLRPK